MWWCSTKETRQCHFKYFDKVTKFLSDSYQKIVINKILLCLSQCPPIPRNPTNEWFITIQNGCKSFTTPTAVCQYTVRDTDHLQSYIAWFPAPIMKMRTYVFWVIMQQVVGLNYHSLLHNNPEEHNSQSHISLLSAHCFISIQPMTWLQQILK